MSMTRRQILRGVGGFSLALPFMRSLLSPSLAEAAVPGMRRFVQFASSHGGIWGPNMYPADSTLTQTAAFAGRTVRRGALSLTTQGPDALLSPVLRGAASTLNASLASR
jgi:hypothetical protein